MNCLASLLRLDVCSSDGSNFPVNSLAGVDADFFHRLQKSDEPDIQDLFNDVNSAAWMLFLCSFNEQFTRKYSVVSKSDTFGGLLKPVQSVPAYAGKQGFQIKSINKTNYQYLFVKRLYFWSKTSANVTFEFWDADMSVLLDSVTAAVTSGKNSITINRYFDSENLFICYDGAVAIAFQTDYYGADGSCLNYTCCDGGFLVNGAQSDVLPLDLVYSGWTFGLGASVEQSCLITDLICENANSLMNAYIFAFGAALKQEQKQTKKLNKITVVKPEEAQESYDFYIEKMEKELSNFFQTFTIPEGFCAECRPFLTNIQSV